MAKCAVIGIGNLLRGDDAAGLLAARWLRSRLMRGVDVFESDGDFEQLLYWLAQYSEVYLIDAFDAASNATSWLRIEANEEPIPERFSLSSTHALGLAWTIELARALGQLPSFVVVFGIPAHDFATGAPMSRHTLQATVCALKAMQKEIECKGERG